ncbi:MAG: LPS export ABC transporter permease LptG, partial [Variibacter sp.]|nr:LPS export ABC transporter permease LptG [Variibacter sp.]
MKATTLGRYIAWRFMAAVLAVFLGQLLLMILVDYIELTRRTASIPHATAGLVALTSLYRVPQVVERLLPFSVQVGAMAAYLNLSRRNELVIARAAGLSAWQFVAPAVIAAMLLGVAITLVYNPVAAYLGEQSKRLEDQIFGVRGDSSSRFWLRQSSGDGQSILEAANSRDQGETLSGVSAFLFDQKGTFTGRVEAESAKLEPGQWILRNARVYAANVQPKELSTYSLPTNLTLAQVRESFATPETVPIWQLPFYIHLQESSGLVAAGYRFQFHSLIARPFFLASMVLLASAVSLRFFRFGGVANMVMIGVSVGFLLYVLAKVTEDLSKAQVIHAVVAVWLPITIG